jgi:hypothetical protein
MATYTADGGDKKGILRLKIVLSIISNLVLVGIIILLQITSGGFIVLLFLGLNIFWVLGLLKSSYKSFTLTPSLLEIKFRKNVRRYHFSDMKNIKFYFNSFVNEGGQYIKGMNVCEITLSNGELIEIIEEEIDNFNEFKAELLEKTKC